jgi:hypothetical protein
MKSSKLLLFAVLSLPFLISSCSKNSNSVEPPTTAPFIVGNWNLMYRSDTLYYYNDLVTQTTYINPTNMYRSIKFESDGTVYTTTSFYVGVAALYGPLYVLQPYLFSTAIIDTANYAINNNVISYTKRGYIGRYASNDSIVAIDNNKLVLVDTSFFAQKTTYYYSK